MCIDLGFHHLPSSVDVADVGKKRIVFWHIYVMEKGMAFTLGRTPTIHQHDISTEKPTVPKGIGAPG
jgi:hypothetical protein